MAATVLGGVGAATSVVLVGGLFGVAGVIVGVVALRTARRTGVGRGRAVTGVVLSSFAVVASVLVVFLALWFAGRTQSCYRFDELGPWRQCVGEQLFGG
ncbi:DUF4190 domain-containing protein [Kitasatospora sp. NPDC048239]|uniref:DUF4190 domain-containing protein n=1 Tax=Kitasatospora sp. NPDC048239 TaxID=3364046 RepID=UPI003722C78D